MLTSAFVQRAQTLARHRCSIKKKLEIEILYVEIIKHNIFESFKTKRNESFFESIFFLIYIYLYRKKYLMKNTIWFIS